jgi:hypothetical protein
MLMAKSVKPHLHKTTVSCCVSLPLFYNTGQLKYYSWGLALAASLQKIGCALPCGLLQSGCIADICTKFELLLFSFLDFVYNFLNYCTWFKLPFDCSEFPYSFSDFPSAYSDFPDDCSDFLGGCSDFPDDSSDFPDGCSDFPDDYSDFPYSLSNF